MFPIVAVLATTPPNADELGRIGFPAGSADPNGQVDAQLDAAMTWAARNPRGVIVLDGHAPTARLSHDRAVVVRDQLVDAGIQPYQIVISVFADDGAAVVIWGARQ